MRWSAARTRLLAVLVHALVLALVLALALATSACGRGESAPDAGTKEATKVPVKPTPSAERPRVETTDAASDAAPDAMASAALLSPADLAVLETSLVYQKGQRAPDDAHVRALLAKARILTANPNIKISVFAYADDTASDKDNLDISFARSKAAVDILFKAGVREPQVWIENHGSVSEKGKGIDFHLQRR